jgi:hypothetical protein
MTAALILTVLLWLVIYLAVDLFDWAFKGCRPAWIPERRRRH